MTIDIFKDFTKKNIVLWIKELYNFILKPQSFIEKYSSKPSDQLFSQYLFYFISYTFSYLLVASTVEFNSLIKPSILNLCICIPTILFFSASAKIATRRSYFKKISLFVVTVQVIALTANVLLAALFITTENHLYVLIDSFITGVIILYELYGFSYIIEKRKGRATAILAVSLTLSTTIYLSVNYQFDKINFPNIDSRIENDYIYTDYRELLSGVNHRVEIPISESLTLNGKSLLTAYGVSDLRKSGFIIDSSYIAKYHSDIKNNISRIIKKLDNIQFPGNKDVAYKYLKHYKLVDSLLKINNYESVNNKINMLVIEESLKKVKKYKINTEFDTTIINDWNYIRTYNNRVVTLHNWNTSIIEIGDSFVFFFGRVIENLIYPDERTLPYKDYIPVSYNTNLSSGFSGLFYI